MRNTYLVYKQLNGVRQLVAATQEEWNAILKENRLLPLSERRCFIKDCIEDGDELDCMYIEVSISEHRDWNNKNSVQQRKRKIGMLYAHLPWTPEFQIPALNCCMRAFPATSVLRAL